MAGNTILNTSPAIRAQLYSQQLLEVLKDDFLPEGLHRNVTEFGDGDKIDIPTIGEMTLYDIQEEQDTPLSAVDMGKVSLTITDHVGTGGYITDELKEDGYKAMAVESAIVPESLRAIRERYETDMLRQVNGQVSGDPNTINGFDHRWVAGSTTAGLLDVEDFVYAKLAFDKANVPQEGRIMIVDPIVEARLNSLIGVEAFNPSSDYDRFVGTGFARGNKFLANFMGFDIWISNRMPRVDSETVNGGPQGASTSISNGVINQFMCVASDDIKPYMGAWRRMPRVEGERNVSKRRDEFHVTSRWGFGVQRFETLGSIITSANSYK